MLVAENMCHVFVPVGIHFLTELVWRHKSQTMKEGKALMYVLYIEAFFSCQRIKKIVRMNLILKKRSGKWLNWQLRRIMADLN